MIATKMAQGVTSEKMSNPDSGFRRSDDSRRYPPRTRPRYLPCFLVLANLLFTSRADLSIAADYPAGPEDYRTYLSRLGPGDRLLLREGDYPRGLPLHDLEGRSDAPIIIQGPRGGPHAGPRARFIARPGVNTVSLLNVRHVILRNLELDGANQRVDAVKAEGHARYAHHVTLENLYIHDFAASQQNVGISSKCPAFGWIIRDNRIERVGTGLYLGDSDGSDPFVAGLIEGNHISATLGYNLQIKHQKARPEDMPEAGERHDTIIRRNFFSKAGAAPNVQSRPNVLVGHFPRQGNGSEDRYRIYGNLFWQNPGEALFQGEGNVALHDNLFVNVEGAAIRIQPHNDVPRRVEVFRNTVLARDGGITLRNAEEGPKFPQTVTANLVFAARPLEPLGWAGNLTGPHELAARYLRQPYASLDELDLAPRLPVFAGVGISPDYPEAELDYTRKPRLRNGMGACQTARAKRYCGMRSVSSLRSE